MNLVVQKKSLYASERELIGTSEYNCPLIEVLERQKWNNGLISGSILIGSNKETDVEREIEINSLNKPALSPF